MYNVNDDNLQMQNQWTGQLIGHFKIYGASFLSFG
jgi:hypothetical protein